MADGDSDLVRFWFEFDVRDLVPDLGPNVGVHLDGGTLAYRLCCRGVGVTGYNERDCLELLAAVVAPDAVPPLIRATRDVDISKLGLEPSTVGVTAWRGVWFPDQNPGGPAGT